MVAYIGHSTTQEAENIKVCITKTIIGLSELLGVKGSLFGALKVIEVRNTKLQTIFFVVDWKIVFGVRKKTKTSKIWSHVIFCLESLFSGIRFRE